jgi:hypothetical protein
MAISEQGMTLKLRAKQLVRNLHLNSNTCSARSVSFPKRVVVRVGAKAGEADFIPTLLHHVSHYRADNKL